MPQTRDDSNVLQHSTKKDYSMTSSKHFLLSTISAVALASTSAIHTCGLLPDTTTQFHLIVENGIAKTTGLLPVKTPKKFQMKALAGIVESTQAVGITFVATPDFTPLLDPTFVGKVKSQESADTTVYIGTMQAVTGDDDIGDGELVVLAIGPKAKSMIDVFAELGDYKAIDITVVKQFFTSLMSADNNVAPNAGKSAGAQKPATAEA